MFSGGNAPNNKRHYKHAPGTRMLETNHKQASPMPRQRTSVMYAESTVFASNSAELSAAPKSNLKSSFAHTMQ